MTTNNGPDNTNPKGGKEQRPYATLDLTAEDVSPKTSAAAGASAEKEPGAAERPKIGAPEAGKPRETPPHDRDFGFYGLASHMAAGALGAVLALVLYAMATSGADTSDLTADEAVALRKEIAKTAEKLTGFENRLQKAAEPSAEAKAANAEAAALKQNLAGLSQKIAALETRPAASAVSQETVEQTLDPIAARLAALEERVASVAKTQSEVNTNAKATALALALYNLRRAADEGKPYAAELKSIAEISPVPLDLAALEAHGSEGVPSLERLKAEFGTAADAAIASENRPADESWASELWSKAKSFVTVRRKGDVPGDTTRAILARAEFRLGKGDLKAAAEEAAQLKGPAAETMAPWVSKLKARIAAEDALKGLEAKLLTAIGGEDGGKRGG
ncbi:MAG: hypothetical protein HC850_15095 [Rhodomicrobium sp.]|nr:hypothetical protein [Rhodomicrobium sp.]